MISALRFIKNRRRKSSNLIIDKLEDFAQKSDFTAKIGLYFVKGCHQSIFVSSTKGYETIEKLSTFLDEIKVFDIKELMWDYYKKEIDPQN